MHPLEKFRFCPVCGSRRFVESSVKSKKCGDCGFEYFMNPSAAVAAFIVNGRGELLAERRKFEPCRGTLDLPGGFSDIMETSEESVAREVMEETGLRISGARYLFSLPNIYLYSGMNIHTLDMFYLCRAEDTATAAPHDDAAECLWIPLDEVRPELFGLHSIRKGIGIFMEMREGDGSAL